MPFSNAANNAANQQQRAASALRLQIALRKQRRYVETLESQTFPATNAARLARRKVHALENELRTL